MEIINRHRKTLTALATGLLGWATLVTMSTNVPISSAEWVNLGVVIATALGVYSVGNK